MTVRSKHLLVLLAALVGLPILVIGISLLTSESNVATVKDGRSSMERRAIVECGDILKHGPVDVEETWGQHTTGYGEVWIFQQTDGNAVQVWSKPYTTVDPVTLRPTDTYPIGLGYDCGSGFQPW